MTEKLNRMLSVALILAIVGVGVFWGIQRRKSATSRSTTVRTQAQQDSGQWVRDFLSKRAFTEAENQKLEQVFKSQAYQDFLTTDPSSVKDILDFFASQGVKLRYNEFLAEFHEMFQELFPQDSAAALEPKMRENLSALFWESNIQFGTDAASESVRDVIVEFLVEEPNIVWAMAHFEGDYFAIGRWAMDVLQNPILPAAEEPDFSDRLEPPIHEEEELVNTATEQPPKEPQINEDPVQSVESPSFEDFASSTEGEDDILTESEVDIEAALTPEASTEESLETLLRGSFSPERFNRAMQTLNRYGTEEGIRRLQASDPEVAEHVTRLLRRQQEKK